MNSMDAYSSKLDQNDFFGVNLQLLNLVGILPRSGIFTSPWKVIFYNTYSIIAPIWCFPPLLALLYSMYENWDDISVVTGMVFQLSFLVNCIGVYVYLIFNRNSLQTIITTPEEAFGRHIKQLELDRMGLYDTVMAEAYRQNTILTRTVLTLNAIVYILWTIIPFVLWSIQTENDIRNMENSEINRSYNDGQWKFFCFRMWLPQNATQTPMYQFIYIYQAIENSFVILLQITHLMITLSLMLYLTAQFKVLTASLERVDDLPPYLKDVRISDDEISGTKPKEHSQSGNEENLTTINKNIGHSGRYEVMHRDEGDEWVETDGLETLHIQNDEEMYCFLVNCVKYHQFILQRTEDTRKLLSPVLFIDFVVGLAMMCTTAFQVAVGSEQGINFRLIAAAVSVWYPIFLICWFGERLSEQCLRVHQASCRCRWYIRTPLFKRTLFFLIMRAQKPVQFNAGRFFVVSLETFSHMANTAYGYYTILKRMHYS